MHDLRTLLSPRHLTRVALYFALAMGLLVFAGWPSSYSLAASNSPQLLLWCAWLCTYLLGHAVLESAAHTHARESESLPGDWVRYTGASPFLVLVGKLLGTLCATLLWLAVAAPFLVMASVLTPLRVPLGLLYSYWLLLGVTLSGWGVWATLRLINRGTRSWALSGLWTVLFLLPWLRLETFGTPIAEIVIRSPIRVVQHLVAPEGGLQGPLVWSSVIALILTAVTGYGLALLHLRHWRHHDPPSSDHRP